MVADGRALLAAVLAHPQDDAPRLAYADWLAANGQPERAELIRGHTNRISEQAAQELAQRFGKVAEGATLSVGP